jgi:hypothetical protein
MVQAATIPIVWRSFVIPERKVAVPFGQIKQNASVD